MRLKNYVSLMIFQKSHSIMIINLNKIILIHLLLIVNPKIFKVWVIIKKVSFFLKKLKKKIQIK